MAESTREESKTAASSPDSTSGVTNGLRAPKDRNCPFCGQAFTSSSLGRHLDLYIKARNPKAPDGVHDVDEIRKLRGGITRRQPRTSVKTQSQHEDGANESSESWREQALRDTEGERQQSPEGAHGGRMRTYFNAANWQATGVINNLPPREPSRNSTHTPQTHAPAQRQLDGTGEDSSRRMHRPEESNSETARLDDAAERRAAELALREVLGSLEAAAKKTAEPPRMFADFDFFALAFPGLCLAMLPPPPTVFSSTPFSLAHTWSMSAPGEQQRAALHRALHERITAARTEHPDAFSDSVAFQYHVHLDGAYEHWETLSESDRATAWTLELCRAFSQEREHKQRLQREVVAARQRIRHLEADYDRISRFQLPREYLLHPPNTIPISTGAVVELQAQGIVDRAAEVDFDADALLRRWKTRVKATARPPRPPPQPRHIEVRRSELKTDMYMTGSVFGVNGPMSRENSESHASRQIAEIEETEGETRTEPSISPAGQVSHAAVVKFRAVSDSPTSESTVNANGKRLLRPSSVNGRRPGPKVYKERIV